MTHGLSRGSTIGKSWFLEHDIHALPPRARDYGGRVADVTAVENYNYYGNRRRSRVLESLYLGNRINESLLSREIRSPR